MTPALHVKKKVWSFSEIKHKPQSMEDKIIRRRLVCKQNH